MMDTIKSAHAALLNRLSEMQAAPYYATARDTLAQAERVIVQLEAITTAPRGTDAQILKERELTAAAINGAIAFGALGKDAPPEPSHWLMPFWKIGKDQARAEQIADEAMMVALRSYGAPSFDDKGGFRPANRGARYRTLAEAYPELREAVAWLQPRGYVELCTDEDGEFIKVLRLPGESE